MQQYSFYILFIYSFDCKEELALLRFLLQQTFALAEKLT